MSIDFKAAAQKALKNAMEAYVMYIPTLSSFEAPAGDYTIWEEDTKDLLKNINLLDIAECLKGVYWVSYTILEGGGFR